MKIPFSYRSHFFGSFLALSTVGHVLTFVAGTGLFIPSAQYAVEQAPSSMEMLVVKERPREEPKIKEESVLTAAAGAEAVEQKKSRPKPQLIRSAQAPAAKGAVTKAKPAYYKNPAPIYPRIARESGWEGLVILRVLVGKDGRVREILAGKSSGYAVLDESALKAVRAWRFLPARAGHMTFSSRVTIPVRFVLKESQ